MPYTSNKKSTDLETKTPPIDADVLILGDSADTGRAKGLTWANVKATLFASPAFTGNPTAPTQTASDNSTKLATTAYVDNQITASSVTLVTTVNISSADILALHTTPKELIPAPGAGKIIVIDSFVWKLIYGSATYANGDHGKVIYQSDTTNLLAGIITDSVYIKAVADVVGVFDVAITINGTVGINKAVQLTLNSATAYITGNSTAKVFIKYRIITL